MSFVMLCDFNHFCYFAHSRPIRTIFFANKCYPLGRLVGSRIIIETVPAAAHLSHPQHFTWQMPIFRLNGRPLTEWESVAIDLGPDRLVKSLQLSCLLHRIGGGGGRMTMEEKKSDNCKYFSDRPFSSRTQSAQHPSSSH